MAEFGRIDIVLANAGIAPHAAVDTDPAAVFDDVIAVNLTGVYHTVHAAVPHMIDNAEVDRSCSQALSRDFPAGPVPGPARGTGTRYPSTVSSG